MAETEDELWYPTVSDVRAIHDDVIAEHPDSEPGVRDVEQLQFVIDYIETGHFGEVPETVHEKAFHLMRLLAANHYFVDGNKRTALNSTVVFYATNRYRLEYGDDVRSMLKLLSVREELLDEEATTDYLSAQTERSALVESVPTFEGEVVEDAREETVREIAKRDRDAHRDIYDALADE